MSIVDHIEMRNAERRELREQIKQLQREKNKALDALSPANIKQARARAREEYQAKLASLRPAIIQPRRDKIKRDFVRDKEKLRADYRNRVELEKELQPKTLDGLARKEVDMDVLQNMKNAESKLIKNGRKQTSADHSLLFAERREIKEKRQQLEREERERSRRLKEDEEIAQARREGDKYIINSSGRIQSLTAFRTGVHLLAKNNTYTGSEVVVWPGTIGGYVDGYHNLSQDGTCWIHGNGEVREQAHVSGDAQIVEAKILGSARLTTGVHRRKEIIEDMPVYFDDEGMARWKATDKVAGTIQKEGRRIMINGKRYMAHHIAWYIAHGDWPDRSLMHKDGNKDNNRINNLTM